MKKIPTVVFFTITLLGYLFGAFTSSPIAPIIWLPALILGLIKLFTKKKNN